VTGKGFVNRVVDNLIDKVMKSALSNIANIHGRPFADRL
jgi:hypothetical protein